MLNASDRPLHGTNWGGARDGAGRPAKEPSQDQKNLVGQKARHEKVKADLAELEYKKQTGEVVLRAAVKQASATALATLAQALRTIPDLLERRYAIAPEVAEAIGKEIDDELDRVADAFEKMAREPQGEFEPETPAESGIDLFA